MRKQILTLFLILAVSAPVFAGEIPERHGNVTIRGEAAVVVPSDRVTISANISSVQKNYKIAVNEVEGTLKSAVDALRKLGIADKSLTYADLNANPHYEYTDKGTILTGFEVNRFLKIELDSLELLGQVFEILLAVKVTAVNGPNYEVENREAIYRQALAAAAADADAKVQVLAKELGLKNLRLINLNEIQNMGYGGHSMAVNESVQNASITRPVFSATTRTVGAEVNAVYEFSN